MTMPELDERWSIVYDSLKIDIVIYSFLSILLSQAESIHIAFLLYLALYIIWGLCEY